MNQKILLVIGLVIIALLGVLFWSGSTPTANVILSAKDQEAVQLAAVLPMTGITSYYGQQAFRGMQLAMTEIEQGGGKIELTLEDSASKENMAVSALQKLIGQNSFSAVIVGASSPETLAMAPVAEKSETVLLACGSAAPKIRFSGDYIFRLKLSADIETNQLVDYAYDRLNAKTMSILFVNNDYGLGVKEPAVQRFTERGGQLLNMDSFLVSDTDFRTIITKTKQENPDVVLIVGWPPNMGHLLKQAKELGLDKPFIMPFGAYSPEVIEIARSAADGVITDAEYNMDRNSENALFFKNAYLEKYHENPEMFSAMGYDAVKLLYQYVKECRNESACVKTKLYETQQYNGASALVSFDSFGDVNNSVIFKQILNGKLEKINPN